MAVRTVEMTSRCFLPLCYPGIRPTPLLSSMFHDMMITEVKCSHYYCFFTIISLIGVAVFVLVGAKRGEVIVMRKLIGRRWICNQGKISF